MIAALPWYPAARPALDRLWAGVRTRLGHGPDALTWPTDLEAHWARGDLLLTQTCAPIWARRFVGRLHVVGALDFGVAAPGLYRSALVTRIGEDRSLPRAAARVAVNAFDSQSGWGALAGLPLGTVLETGSHAASVDAVARGAADLAAIDAVTWGLAPHPALTVRAWTSPAPAPPLLTGDPAQVAPLRAALAGAIAAMPRADRKTTGLRALVPLDATFYRDLAPLPRAPRCNRGQSAA